MTKMMIIDHDEGGVVVDDYKDEERNDVVENEGDGDAQKKMMRKWKEMLC